MTRRGFAMLAAAALPLAARTPLDAYSDGTPDFLRLGREDERVFRRWFTFLAEAQYFQPAESRPPEIVDCAALIRYAYREALRVHDSRWAATARLPLLTAADSVAAWHYPDPRLGANLFRVVPGPFLPEDVSNGAFAQFADVRTLGLYNTFRVARELDRALPGDLLLYRQESDRMPFHSMIWLGPSQITRDAARYVVYHTGPSRGGQGASGTAAPIHGTGRTGHAAVAEDGRPGIVRRLTADELLRYPEPEWRPLAANPHFLGVYRWNILRNLS